MPSKNFGNVANSNFSSGARDIFANFQGSNKKNTSSSNEEYTFKKIPVANIKLNPNNKNYNKNDTDSDIEDLAARIDLEGLLSPLIVYQAGRNQYILLAGERRFRAISTKLKWKEVECKVYTRISDSLKTFVLNETNLGRPLTDEQRFIGYQEIVNVLTNNDEYDKDKVARLCNLSKYKMRQFETIRQNTEQSDVDKLQSGEITFKDIKEIAEAKKQVAIATKRIEEASKIYAEAIENPNIKFYIDRKNKYLFSVGSRKDNATEFFGVKVHNYSEVQNNIIFRWATDVELPECSSQTEAQVHLDSYAINHNLEECSVEEFLSKSQGENKKSIQDSDNTTSETEVQKDTAAIDNSNVFPEIVAQNADEEVFEYQQRHADNNTDETEQEESSDTDTDANTHTEPLSTESKDKIDKENFAYSDNLIRENDNNSVDVETNEELEKYKNNYALSITFVGLEINSHQPIKGTLVYDDINDKYFIIPVIKIGEDLSTEEQSKRNIYGIGYEVEKSSIHTETNKK